MNIEKIKKSTLFPFLLPLFILIGVVSIFNAGYLVGQWLYQITH